MRQSWRDVLFMHWPMPAAVLRRMVPEPLEVETFAGEAWISISPFVVTGLRLRGFPPLPGVSRFPELNLRTYVSYDGKPGVHFFSLDAGSRLAVLGARLAYRLPYHRASMHVTPIDGWIAYRSLRRGHEPAELVVRYRPAGERAIATPGTLDYFLTERYALYTVTGSGRVLRAEIDHPPWELQPAEAVIEHNTIASAHGLTLPDVDPVLHFARSQTTRVWPPVPLPLRRSAMRTGEAPARS
jgi:hypothetical protein